MQFDSYRNVRRTSQKIRQLDASLSRASSALTKNPMRGGGGGRGTPQVFGGGVRPELRNLDPISAKICDCPYPISALSEKSIPHNTPLKLVHDSYIWLQLTRTGFHLRAHLRRVTNLQMLMRKKIVPCKQKTHCQDDLFQTKMVKIYALFHTKTAHKPYPSGLHLPIHV